MADDLEAPIVETEDAAPVDAPRQSLDDIISAALDNSELGEQPRDPRGRFAPKGDEEIPTGKPGEGGQTADTQSLAAPEDWDAAAKARFAAWPRDVQEAVIERAKAMHADYTRKSQETADARKAAEPFLQAVGVHQDYLDQLSRQGGIPPAQIIMGLLNAERTLRTGTPQQKLHAAATVLRDYGIDLSAFAGQPQGQPPPQGFQPQAQPADPRIDEMYRYHQEQIIGSLHSQIGGFKDAKDESGQLRYPYFDHVKTLMGHKMRFEGVPTMEEAYELSVAPIKAALAAARPAAPQQTEQEKAAALAKARKAAPVRASGTTPKGTTQAKGLDAIISAALDQHGF